MHRVSQMTFVCVFLCATAVHAQPREPTSREARDAFVRAVRLFDEGQRDEALALFERAWSLSGQPLILLNIAAAQEALGHPVEALEALERFEQTAPEAARAARRAQVEAAMGRTRTRVATLRVRADIEGLRVRIDGVDHAPETLNAGVRLVAGEHRVALEAQGFHPREVTLALDGGGTHMLDTTLERDPPPPPPPIVLATQPPLAPVVRAPPVRAVAAPRSRAVGLGLVIGGGAVTLGGSVALALSMTAWRRHVRNQDALERDAINNEPGARRSYNALADLIAADHRYVVGAAVTLGVGVAVTVTGALLLRSARRPAVAVDWTPTGWSLVGTF